MPLIPNLPVSEKEASVTEKWIEWARDTPYPATIQLPSLCVSVTLSPARIQKSGIPCCLLIPACALIHGAWPHFCA